MDSDFPEFDLRFCVREYEGEPVQYLSILPMAFLGTQYALGTGGLIRVDIKLVVARSQVIVEDHLTASDFAELHELLISRVAQIDRAELGLPRDKKTYLIAPKASCKPRLHSNLV